MSDSRSEARFKVILPALCWGRGRADFYAVTEELSSAGIRFRSSIIPFVEEALTCSIRHAGSVETIVLRTSPNSFTVRVLRADHPLGLVVQSLVSLGKAQNPPPIATRVHRRIVPNMRQVLVKTAVGTMLPGLIINISASGVAISLEESLDVGTLITVGRTKAKVARRFDDGIGASFLTPLHQDKVGPHVVL